METSRYAPRITAEDPATLPTFLVIGAMKAGTTSLHAYLGAHPDVFMAEPKELDFFLDDGNWRRGVEWYRGKFTGADGATARGEASPSYTKYPAVPHVPERIVGLLPDVRLVYVVRDPIERMRSQWRQNAVYEGETRSVDDALLRDPHYLACSRYAFQLDQYTEHFPRDRILVVTSESLRNDRAATVARVLEFIGVEPTLDADDLSREAHQSTATRARGRLGRLARRVPGHAAIARATPRRVLDAWHRTTSHELPGDALAASTRQRLTEQLAPDVVRLRSWLGEDFDGWGLA
ncbi:MAG TPA: sulfotransferase [Acidimicrobiales bacterium]|nr:sulfotransferase [Acidimicrobiales bacterium]